MFSSTNKAKYVQKYYFSRLLLDPRLKNKKLLKMHPRLGITLIQFKKSNICILPKQTILGYWFLNHHLLGQYLQLRLHQGLE